MLHLIRQFGEMLISDLGQNIFSAKTIPVKMHKAAKVFGVKLKLRCDDGRKCCNRSLVNLRRNDLLRGKINRRPNEIVAKYVRYCMDLINMIIARRAKSFFIQPHAGKRGIHCGRIVGDNLYYYLCLSRFFLYLLNLRNSGYLCGVLAETGKFSRCLFLPEQA